MELLLLPNLLYSKITQRLLLVELFKNCTASFEKSSSSTIASKYQFSLTLNQFSALKLLFLSKTAPSHTEQFIKHFILFFQHILSKHCIFVFSALNPFTLSEKSFHPLNTDSSSSIYYPATTQLFERKNLILFPLLLQQLFGDKF